MGQKRRNFTEEFIGEGPGRHLFKSGSERGRKADAAEFAQLRRDNKRLKEQVEIYSIEIFYNRQRRHFAIGYKTPIQALENITWKTAA